MSIYLHDWAESGFFGMVADFDDGYITLADEKWQGIDVILASYTAANYSGEAFVLFRKDGQLYEVSGSHCSCYGLEGQWGPEATTLEAIQHRLDSGALGANEWSGNEFATELRAALAGVGGAA